MSEWQNSHVVFLFVRQHAAAAVRRVSFQATAVCLKGVQSPVRRGSFPRNALHWLRARPSQLERELRCASSDASRRRTSCCPLRPHSYAIIVRWMQDRARQQDDHVGVIP
jgi:hypothetical protein